MKHKKEALAKLNRAKKLFQEHVAFLRTQKGNWADPIKECEDAIRDIEAVEHDLTNASMIDAQIMLNRLVNDQDSMMNLIRIIIKSLGGSD
jgi:hypothetical protein